MSPSERGTTSADVGRLQLPAIVVHGGAGRFDHLRSVAELERIETGLEAALAAGWEVLSEGGGALEAAVEAVAWFEDSGRFNAGRGAVATSAGAHEFDAGVMDGTTGKVGAICSATWPANPVRVARRVADIGGPPDGPVLLAGAGADHFAESCGFERMTPAMLASSTRETEDREATVSEEGTVGAVTVDADGRVAAATSTGGRRGQRPGRVGDSPLPGAGIWADAATAAVSATGAGEAFIVAGFGHRIDWAMRHGDDLPAAMREALDAVARLGGDGGGIALAPDGSFAACFNSAAMARGWRDRSGSVSRLRPTGC